LDIIQNPTSGVLSEELVKVNKYRKDAYGSINNDSSEISGPSLKVHIKNIAQSSCSDLDKLLQHLHAESDIDILNSFVTRSYMFGSEDISLDSGDIERVERADETSSAYEANDGNRKNEYYASTATQASISSLERCVLYMCDIQLCGATKLANELQLQVTDSQAKDCDEKKYQSMDVLVERVTRQYNHSLLDTSKFIYKCFSQLSLLSVFSNGIVRSTGKRRRNLALDCLPFIHSMLESQYNIEVIPDELILSGRRSTRAYTQKQVQKFQHLMLALPLGETALTRLMNALSWN
jgi:hypothetical protein